LYKTIIASLFPKGAFKGKVNHNNAWLKQPFFNQIKVSNCFRGIYEGEKQCGRFILLKNKDGSENQISLQFIRFVN